MVLVPKHYVHSILLQRIVHMLLLKVASSIKDLVHMLHEDDVADLLPMIVVQFLQSVLHPFWSPKRNAALECTVQG